MVHPSRAAERRSRGGALLLSSAVDVDALAGAACQRLLNEYPDVVDPA